jgi:hypothetical protein
MSEVQRTYSGLRAPEYLAEDREHRAFSHDCRAERAPYRLASDEQIYGGLPFAQVVGWRTDAPAEAGSALSAGR